MKTLKRNVAGSTALAVFIAFFLMGCSKDQNDNPQFGMLPGVRHPKLSIHGYLNEFWIIAAGQSNMWGQGMMTDPFTAIPQIWVYPGTNSAPQPYNGRLGPAYAFATDLAHDNPNTEIDIIPCSVGGSPASDWIGGGTDFNNCIAYWHEAGAPTPSVILYMQGETEGMSGDPNLAAAWPADFADTVSNLRHVFNGNTKVIFAQIGPNPSSAPSPDFYTWQTVQTEQSQVSIQNVSEVISFDLPLSDDWIHFSQYGYFQIGSRMYAAFKN